MKKILIGPKGPSPAIRRVISLLSVTILFFELGTTLNLCSAADEPGAPAPLRVGITPEYPPLVFRQVDGTTNGLEIDFAKALAAELNRPVQFLVWDKDALMNAISDHQVDIIMSGVAITKARQLRVRFADPYVHTQLRAIFRRKDASQFKTKADILSAKVKIGVIPGTTADIFVKQNCTNAQIINVSQRKDVPYLLLKGGRYDVVVDNVFALADMFAQNEVDMAYLPEALSEEDLAWVLSPEQPELLASVNAVLKKWKADGTLDKMLDRWLPYLKNARQQQSPGQPK